MTTSTNKGTRDSLNWSEAFSVGIPEIDGDHQVLFDLVGQIQDAASGAEPQAVIGTVLAALFDYTDYHFTREERMMEAISYPIFPQHKQRHELLKSQVVEYLGRYSDDPDSVNLGDLSAFLRTWLVEHIQREDMGYKAMARDRQDTAREAIRSVGIAFFMENELTAEGA